MSNRISNNSNPHASQPTEQGIDLGTHSQNASSTTSSNANSTYRNVHSNGNGSELSQAQSVNQSGNPSGKLGTTAMSSPVTQSGAKQLAGDSPGVTPFDRNIASPIPVSLVRVSTPSVPPVPLATPVPAPPSRPAWINWFMNQPIGRKQLAALLMCELIPIVGLGVGSTIVLTNSLRAQLLEQAKSEVAVTEINYNIKVNQMGFGSRGQADNTAIIDAAWTKVQAGTPSEAQKQQVKQILQNEVRARKMEYATLVDREARILISANRNRAGETFNPNNLVSQSLQTAQQIKASAIVSRDELNKEGAALPPEFTNQASDGLIRYVVTPVKDPVSKQVIGALVFGDLVNNKLPIVEGTLKSFGSGYSAVYSRINADTFLPATTLDKNKTDDITNARTNIELSPNQFALLKQAAIAQVGQPVTDRFQIGSKTYTVAAKAVPNRILETPDGPKPEFGPEPVALLVRGTPEDTLNTLLANSLRQEAGVLGLSLLVIILWSVLFRRTILNAIEHLEQTTRTFAQGDRSVRARVYARDEVGQLATSFNQMADSIGQSEQTLAAESQRAQRLSDITLRMRRSLRRDDVLTTAVREMRQVLGCDRVIVYTFNPDWSGTVIAESVQTGWRALLGEVVNDPFREGLIDAYRDGRIRVMDDVEAESLTECHLDILHDFQIRASMTAPIIVNGKLLGLFCAHHCADIRWWHDTDVALFSQVATQFGYALEQADLLEQTDQARQGAETLSEERRQQKETLQQQILSLLGEVEGAVMGDLTVRADVTASDLGTVADFFNSIVESLREIVTSVKQSTTQVNRLLSDNDTAMQSLSESALHQAKATTSMLNSVEQMADSIQAVAANARQAAIVARTASETATTGEVEMDATVTNILGLRRTIDETAQKVRQLGDSSQQISRVVSLINEVAVQIDLLAINAGIEASRAGEQGRGFSIVAAEVGHLAARSATAAREIEQIVETIQRETKLVVDAMNQGTSQVAEGASQVKSAKQSLAQIAQVSRQIDDLVQSISQATVSQARTSQSVAEGIKAISTVSEHTSNSSRQVSETLRQTVAVAQELQDSVGTFKVN
jgi:twitching motility protein PilJ